MFAWSRRVLQNPISAAVGGTLGSRHDKAVPASPHPQAEAPNPLSSSSSLTSSSSAAVATATSVAKTSASSLDTVRAEILKYPYQVISCEAELREAVDVLRRSRQVSLDVEAFCTPESVKSPQLGQVSLVQTCGDTVPVVFLFDILSLSVPTFTAALRPVLCDAEIRKLSFDCRRDIEALSTQMDLVPTRVLDLQLFYTCVQWKLRSVNRRSGMTYVLKSIAGVDRQEGDSAVQTAMSVGDRPVWDTRPLPSHFLEYAADDVRHIHLLSTYFPTLTQHVSMEAVERLTAQYVQHYGVGRPVTVEADLQPAQVNTAWLERFIGPGGVCSFCGSKGHIESECFRKLNSNVRCSYCGATGHTSRNCFQKHPELLKCELCGLLGHTAANCFKTNPCRYCGGNHRSENCHQRVNAGKPTDHKRRRGKSGE
ncbi:hypothetical protein ABB37_00525 [Leptomonas pyrrhocoris]|uniref:CCHC-type domain-containing protein n=1 Tax=Leptomonas pyrrhocoris TaxID=157538 RepID=A0A0M9GAX0_LEPPY|nr:hypothetical protein ABB37_00525 [Leptomonas pyrrhocoris]KPA86306.1 hypothetical protein ABB37_00525 [Leptomonas pyrrhocoris]|eukprot:XP_015664745.1 hypothetical protein ABB37_00525 [Leptomonas pyrrhocoris]